MRAVRLVVRGQVQGVGFRWFAREQARRQGLAGWVRNSPDGAVEIAVAGEPDRVDQFIDAVRRGPPAARVDGVEFESAGVDVAAERPFAIRR